VHFCQLSTGLNVNIKLVIANYTNHAFTIATVPNAGHDLDWTVVTTKGDSCNVWLDLFMNWGINGDGQPSSVAGLQLDRFAIVHKREPAWRRLRGLRLSDLLSDGICIISRPRSGISVNVIHDARPDSIASVRLVHNPMFSTGAMDP
jgi:hypothetical protein